MVKSNTTVETKTQVEQDEKYSKLEQEIKELKDFMRQLIDLLKQNKLAVPTPSLYTNAKSSNDVNLSDDEQTTNKKAKNMSSKRTIN